MKTLCFLLVLAVCPVALPAQDPSPKPLNVDYMVRGYFYAASPQVASTRGFGGWWEADNLFRDVKTLDPFDPGQLTVMILPNETGVFAGKFAAMILYVANLENDTIYFDAQDSRIKMKMQAFHEGQWKDIEYLPSSWCGNSYHMVYLPSQTCWKFLTPRYEGKIKTRLRAALQFKRSTEGAEEWIFSNEIDGSVNAGQFSKMKKYKPNGIMDPYFN